MIPDPARLEAVFRARESERPDAVFRDPYARALAGERGEQIVRAIPFADKNDWSLVARTYAFDRLIAKEVANGVDLVVNLGAGLDTRPYRMELPPSLRWVEVDAPEVVEYKDGMLAGAKPACVLERVGLDLMNYDARRGLFADLDRRASRTLVLTEGLLIHLMASEVGALAHDLAAQATFQRWIADIASPALMKILDERTGDLARAAGAPYVFAPYDGPAFFERYGWQVLGVRSMLKTAAKLERLPMMLRLFAMMPEGQRPGDRPWAGVCLLGKP